MVGDAQRLGHPLGEVCRDALQHKGKAADGLELVSFLEEPDGVLGSPALHLEDAHGMHAVRRQAQVPHDRDLAVDQRANDRQALGAAFQLDGCRATLEEASGIAQRILQAQVVAQIWHVGYHQSPRPGADDRPEMMVHHGHAHRERIIEAQAHVADAVTDQDHVDHWIS
jgi:hypothetical protein